MVEEKQIAEEEQEEKNTDIPKDESVEESAETEDENSTDQSEEETDAEPEEDTEESTDNEQEPEQEGLMKLKDQVQEYREKLVRKAAEFENYKKRTSEEFLRLIKSANEDACLKLLPVLDDIERFEKNYTDKMKKDDLKKAVDMIFNKFSTTMISFGLKEIEAVGNEFNPEYHEALLQVENKDVEPNHIIDQHEKGYKMNDKVIRHSKVIVSK